MKRFSFRLDRVLQLREAAEREQARALGVALRAEEADRLAARESEERLAEARERFAATPREMSQAGTLRNLEMAIDRLAGEFEARTRTHEESLARLEAERHQFEQVRMARRVIERLKEQRKEAWHGEVNRHEQASNDEVALRLAQGRQEGSE